MEFYWYPYHMISVFLILISLFLFGYIYSRRYSLGAKYLMGMVALMILWIIGQGLEIAVTGIRNKILFSNIHYISITYLPVLYLYLALSFSGNHRLAKSKLLRWVLIAEPVVLNLLLWIDLNTEILRTGFYLEETSIIIAVGKQFTALMTPFVVYNFILTGTILIILLRSWLDKSFYYRKQAKYLLFGLFVPTMVTLLFFFDINFYGIDITPVSFIFSDILIVYGILKHGMYGLSEIALDNVFNEMKSSVMVYDQALNLVNMNISCLKLFDLKKGQVIGKSVREVFSKVPEVKDALTQKDFFHGEVDIPFYNQNKTYDLTVNPIKSENNQTLGWIANLYDITERKSAERLLMEDKKNALSLFERKEKELLANESAFLQSQIKPHFLYNSLNVIAAICCVEPEKARMLLLDLSDYMHYSYDLRKLDEFISFEDELELIYSYVRIEQARFQNKIQVHFDLDEAKDLMLPPLILQPLVENAIRHGIRKKKEACTVSLSLKKFWMPKSLPMLFSSPLTANTQSRLLKSMLLTILSNR